MKKAIAPHFVKTIIIAQEGNPITIKIYVINETMEQGLWNVDDNTVLLSRRLYADLNLADTQKLQGRFFSELKKVSQRLVE